MRHYIIIVGFFFFAHALSAQEVESKGMWLLAIVENGDTIFQGPQLPTIYVFPSLKFKNSRAEKFYWKTVRDVKVTLPYAKLVATTLFETEEYLKSITPKEQKNFLKTYEKQLFRKYEKDLRKMTFSQGKMLVRLIDRECDRSAYEIIKMYRGGFTAFFWQGIGRIFGMNLKAEYDGEDRDRIIERVITLVEAGAL